MLKRTTAKINKDLKGTNTAKRNPPHTNKHKRIREGDRSSKEGEI
jgi:hypothetical protein